MIPLSILSDPSDLVAFLSLGTLAIVFGLLPASRVAGMWGRKRAEVVLIWAIASLHRGAEFAHLVSIAGMLHLASAVVAALSAFTAVRSLVRGRGRHVVPR